MGVLKQDRSIQQLLQILFPDKIIKKQFCVGLSVKCRNGRGETERMREGVKGRLREGNRYARADSCILRGAGRTLFVSGC